MKNSPHELKIIACVGNFLCHGEKGLSVIFEKYCVL